MVLNKIGINTYRENVGRVLPSLCELVDLYNIEEYRVQSVYTGERSGILKQALPEYLPPWPFGLRQSDSPGHPPRTPA